MTTLEILIEARRLLATGWCKNMCQVIHGGEVIARDIVTALNDAAGGRGMVAIGTSEHKRAYQMVWDATGGAGIIAFNDDPRTTHGEVVWVLSNCIAELTHWLPAEHAAVEA